MRTLALNIPVKVSSFKRKDIVEINIQNKPIEQQVSWLIVRDLERLNWEVKLPTKKKPFISIIPPESYDKDTIKNAMAIKREEIICKKEE